MIRGVIFDFDGLMLDTEGPDYHSWRETFQAHGCDLPLAAWAACIGGSGQDLDPYAMLETASARPVDRAMVRAARRRRFAGLIATEQVLPGVLDYIDTARRLSLKLAVASSSSRSWVAGHLARLYCVAIPNPLTCQLPLDHADLRLISLTDLPLEHLIERINA
jgi:beta-phosphoglucomutase-like phosphatase (HAD superfamily)